jgi:hypothetical protein
MGAQRRKIQSHAYQVGGGMEQSGNAADFLKILYDVSPCEECHLFTIFLYL